MSILESARAYGRGVDAVIAATLAVLTMLYVTRVWPHDLYVADEGLLLYEGKRVLDGDVMYRDFFEITAPGGVYLVALAYWLFGVSMETARLVHAATHAAIIVVSYAICHLLGVRRTIAIALALADITYAYQALPMTSPHWMGTMLVLLLLWLALWLRAGRTARAAFALGMACGVVAVVQHQKAAFVATGIILLLLLDHLFVPPRAPSSVLLRRVGGFALGTASTFGPVALYFVWAAGAEHVIEALIYHPLVHYRSYNRVGWGAASWLHPELYVRPDLMRRWPLIVPVVALQFAWNAVRGTDAAHVRQPLTLALIGAAAVGSIWYYPDYIHLGSVAPVAFVLVAAWSERALRVVEDRFRVPAFVGSTLAVLLWWPMITQAHTNQDIRRQLYPFAHQTEFGHVDLKQAPEVELIDTIRRLVREAPGNRALFCYPGCSSVYLETGTRNPTRFQLLLPGYSTAAHFDEVIGTLEQHAVPLVVVMLTGGKGHDPLRAYLRRHYDLVRYSSERIPAFFLLQRRAPPEMQSVF